MCAVTLTLPQLEGSQRCPGARSWGGCCRGVFAVSKLTITLTHFAGETGFPRYQNWGGNALGVFFAIRAVTLPLLPLEGAKGRPRTQITGGDASTNPVEAPLTREGATGVFLQSRS